MNRRKRRARFAARRREDRAEQGHRCALDNDLAERLGPAVRELKLNLRPALYHDVHRVLGEPSCPRCPRCVGLRREGKIDGEKPKRAVVLAQWGKLIEEALQQQVRKVDGD